MKNLVTLLLLLGTTSNLVLAEDSNLIEEIVVVGSVSQVDTTDVSDDMAIIEIVMPAMSFTAGGYGGFAGFNERGTQTTHTTVYRNGVPANDSGSGWYDFAHDVVSGLETVNIVSGPNSVLYGSGSLGGTVFINDTIENQGVVRLGEDHQLLNVALFDSISISSFDVSNGSVRNDNTEEDDYKNTTIKSVRDVLGFTVAMTHVDYEYDYDNCYTASFSQSNDCVQNGDKGSFSARNDNYTFGYTFNNANYKTESVETYKSDAERFYADTRHTVGSNIYGATVEYEKYEDMSQDSISAYALLNYEPINIGIRLSEDAFVYRLGAESNDWFGSVGTSYRNPTLYELNGDAWTAPNPNLDPEEAFGGEVGYKNFTVFKYKFSEGINYSFADSQFVNTGSYDTEGVRYTNSFVVERLNTTNIGVELGYTNSDQPRVPEYKAIISSTTELEGFDITFRYTGLFNREPGAYDGTEMLDDVSSLDYKVEKSFPNYLLSFTIRDILDDEFEMVPNYAAGGLEYFLTLQYRP